MRDSVRKSLPQEKKVRGYTIRRMPLGQFLSAMALLREVPETVFQALFDNKTPKEWLHMLAKPNAGALRELMVRAATVLPAPIVTMFAELCGLEPEHLLTDPNVGLDGLLELADAWWEVNGIANFMQAACALGEKVRNATATSGSKG